MIREHSCSDVELPGQRVTSSTLQTVVMRYVIAGEMARGRRIVELGCGPGLGLEYLRECGGRLVVGADRNTELLGMARARSSPEVALVQCDATQMPFRDATFDSILLLETLMYFAEPVTVLREVRRILGDGGTVLLTMPNSAVLGIRPSAGIVRFYSGREVSALLIEAGFVPEVFGAFPLPQGAKKRATRQRVASGVLDGLERCGLPRKIRLRLTSAVLGKDCQLPVRIESSHGRLLPVTDEETGWLSSNADDCRVLYARGVVERR